MIFEDRIVELNDRSIQKGDFILYWMQASQRTLHNHALEYGIQRANELGLPLVVCFGLMEDYPEANERHFKFMLEGLSEVRDKLRGMEIEFVMMKNIPWEAALELSGEAAMVVCDRGYLKHQMAWREKLAERAERMVVQVESDVVVPVEKAAEKEMYSAAALRPRIHRVLGSYMIPFQGSLPLKSSLDMGFDSMDPNDILTDLDLDREVKGVDMYIGGTSQALSRFNDFVYLKLDLYGEKRNDPARSIQSDMGPYLHFGQISPITLAATVNEAGSPGTELFLEELIVRRELAFNFVHYNYRYDELGCLPRWAVETLEDHSSDPRGYEYSRDELENAETHDPYWNSAQKEMVFTGKMHNYMRMYWGKKILEWSKDPETAFRTSIHLNNKYSLDGRDPNSYAGIAWCFGKHDRPWTERPIFGKVRYMNDNGLRRKFRIDEYVKKVETLED
jgi:deoxyribodipyrimidine photo-lyase